MNCETGCQNIIGNGNAAGLIVSFDATAKFP